jgi:hypothetical protein
MSNIIKFPQGYTLRESGNIGQELISPRGKVLAWTTDPAFGVFMVRVCNDILTDDDPVDSIFGEEAEDDE